MSTRERELLVELQKFAKENNISWDKAVDVYHIVSLRYSSAGSTYHPPIEENITAPEAEPEPVTLEAESDASPEDFVDIEVGDMDHV